MTGHRLLVTDHCSLLTLPLLALALWLVVLPARADVLVGTNGDRCTGKVLEETADSVVFESELGGKLTIPRARIREIQPASGLVTDHRLLNTNTPSIPSPPAPRPSTNSALPSLRWVPPEDTFDWIQLKSGEWLKGRIKAMQKRQLDFYSEEMDDQSFSWKDIRQVRSTRSLDVMAVDGTKSTGPVSITPEQVVVGGEHPRVLARDHLQSLTPGGSKERNYWSGNLSAGLTLRKGNSDSVEYNAQAHLQRRTPATRFSLDYVGNLSSINGVESANNHRVNTEFDLWLSRKFYLVVPFAEYYKDPLQNLSHRLTAGAGAGYDLIDRRNLEWTITGGPGLQKAWFASSQPGEPTEKTVAALTFGSRFDWDITSRISLLMEYRGQFTGREVGETTHHFINTLSLKLTQRLDLDVSMIWDRIANPKVGADGVRPKPDDLRLIVGVGIHY